MYAWGLVAGQGQGWTQTQAMGTLDTPYSPSAI